MIINFAIMLREKKFINITKKYQNCIMFSSILVHEKQAMHVYYCRLEFESLNRQRKKYVMIGVYVDVIYNSYNLFSHLFPNNLIYFRLYLNNILGFIKEKIFVKSIVCAV